MRKRTADSRNAIKAVVVRATYRNSPRAASDIDMMDWLVLLLLVGLFAFVLLLRQRQLETSQQQKQSKTDVKPLEETDGRISRDDGCQRTASEWPAVYLMAEGKIVKKNRLGQLQLLLEGRIPELRGELIIHGRVQRNTVMLGISQTVAARLSLPIILDTNQGKLQISMAPADGQLQWELLASWNDYNADNTVIIRNIKPDCDLFELEECIQNETHIEQAHVKRTKDSPSSALLTNLQGTAQVKQVMRKLNNLKCPVTECTLCVETWPEINQLILTDLEEGITTDIMEAYFRDEEKSGCNSLVDVTMKGRGIAVVTLQGSQDVKRIMEKDSYEKFICPGVSLKAYHPKLIPWLELSHQEQRVLIHGDDIHPPFGQPITLELYSFLSTQHMQLETLRSKLDPICAKFELTTAPDNGIITVYPEVGSSPEECRKVVEEFLAEFDTQYRDVPKKTDRKAILEHMNALHRDNDRVVATLREDRVCMAGYKEAVKMECDHLEGVIRDHTMTAKKEKLEMSALQCIDSCERKAFQNKYPKLRFQVLQKESTLSVYGEEIQCQKFLTEAKAFQPNVVDIQLPPEAIVFLGSKNKGKKLLQEVMQKYSHVSHYITDSNGDVLLDDLSTCTGLKIVTCTDAKLAITVAQEVKENVHTDTVEVPVEFKHTVRQDCWVEAQRRMEAEYTAMFRPNLEEDPPVISIVCKADLAKETRAAIEEFVNEECYAKEVITLKEGQYNYMVSQSHDWIQLHAEMKELQKKKHIEFNLPVANSTDCPMLTVKGFTTKVKQVVQRIRQIQSGIKEDTISLSKPGLLEYCKSSTGQQQLIGKAATYKAVLVIRTGEEQQMEDSTTAKELPHKTLVCTDIGGAKVEIMQGDLTEYPVDILVNAANTDLQHGGGIAGQISRKGGPEIQKESSEYISEHGRLKEGDAVLLHATGVLPCKAIIHTVGPKWAGGRAKEEETIAKAVCGSLKLAESESTKYKSTAFPALSTGIYRVPLDVSARGMLAGIKEFLLDNPESTLRVIIMLYKEEDTIPFVSAAEKYLDAEPYKKAKATTFEDLEDDVVVARKPPPRPPPPQVLPAAIPRDDSDVQAAAFTENASAADKLELHKGTLTDFKADVCVNTTSTSLNLSNGMVSKSLLVNGGHTLQEQCNKHIEEHGEVPVWGFATTTGADTHFKFIIHTAGAEYKQGNATKDMESMIGKVMAECDRLKTSSVAFPAIGTGALKFPPNVTAQILVQTVHQYLQGNSSTLVKKVLFVIYQDEVLNAFQKELTALRYMSSGPPGAQPPSAASPMHSLTKCAVRQKSMSPMPITVVKGSLTDAQVDVYVNTTNGSLDLSNGAVAKGLLKAGGRALQDECTRYNRANEDIAVWNIATTEGAGLKCRNVIHTVGGHYDGAASEMGLEKMIGKVMAECNRLKASSVAFPAIGTGNLGFPPDVTARIMVRVAHQFLQRNSKTSVQNIAFYIYQDDILHAFQTEMKAFMSVPAMHPGTIRALSLPTVLPEDSAEVVPAPAVSSPRAMPVTDTQSGTQALLRRNSSRMSFSSATRTMVKELSIGELCIQIINGDITEESSDCLVNVAAPGPRLLDTGLQGAFLKKGGQKLQLAYTAATKEKGNLTKGKVIETAGPVGDLESKLVYHICPPDGHRDLKGTVKSVLERAEKAQVKTVAFPMTLETGKKAFPVEKVAKYYYKGVASFIKDPYWSLTTVIFIDPDERLAHQFLRTFENAASKDGTGLLARGKQAIKAISINRRRSSDAAATVKKQRNPALQRLSSSLSLRLEEEGPVTCFTVYASTEKVAKMVTKEIQHFVVTQFKEEVIHDPNVEQLQLQPHTTDKLYSEAERKHVKLTIEDGNIVLQGHRHDTEQLMNAVHKELSRIATARERWNREKAELQTKQAELRTLQEKAAKDQVEVQKQKAEKGRQQAENESAKKSEELEQIKEHGERPDDWDPMNIDPLTGKEVPYMAVSITPGSTEYAEVAHQFSTSMGAAGSLIRCMQMPYRGIIDIQRIQNPVLYNQYIARKKAMAKANPSNIENEQQLFHGCPRNVTNNINSTGFNRSYCGKNAIAFGQGVYFTTDAQYAARDLYSEPDRNAYGHKHMYLAKVLTGEYTKGRRDMKEPPSKDPYNEAIKFDSTVDDIHDPRIFVVFFDGQAYPGYLITFH